MLLPGLSLRAIPQPLALEPWQHAQNDDVLIFTSPAAVRYAMALAPLVTRGMVIAIGQGTARALRRHGISAQIPAAARQDSEGVLHLLGAQPLQGRHVALITAPGGRGLLQEQLATRGAVVREVHVYERTAPRLNRRHLQAVLQLPATACMLLSSGEALQHLMQQLSGQARLRLRAAMVIVSSERLAEQARSAGFERWQVAASANQADLLAMAAEVCSRARHEAGRAGC
ncbi:uroporphyrinogen III methyltransferase [Dyella mobilis]|nr:uroporphyrinogen III methyltransferase [Dyella mobilis]